MPNSNIPIQPSQPAASYRSPFVPIQPSPETIRRAQAAFNMEAQTYYGLTSDTAYRNLRVLQEQHMRQQGAAMAQAADRYIYDQLIQGAVNLENMAYDAAPSLRIQPLRPREKLPREKIDPLPLP
jgi:hypothetical protein